MRAVGGLLQRGLEARVERAVLEGALEAGGPEVGREAVRSDARDRELERGLAAPAERNRAAVDAHGASDAGKRAGEREPQPLVGPRGVQDDVGDRERLQREYELGHRGDGAVGQLELEVARGQGVELQGDRRGRRRVVASPGRPGRLRLHGARRRAAQLEPGDDQRAALVALHLRAQAGELDRVEVHEVGAQRGQRDLGAVERERVLQVRGQRELAQLDRAGQEQAFELLLRIGGILGVLPESQAGVRDPGDELPAERELLRARNQPRGLEIARQRVHLQARHVEARLEVEMVVDDGRVAVDAQRVQHAGRLDDHLQAGAALARADVGEAQGDLQARADRRDDGRVLDAHVQVLGAQRGDLERAQETEQRLDRRQRGLGGLGRLVVLFGLGRSGLLLVALQILLELPASVLGAAREHVHAVELQAPDPQVSDEQREQAGVELEVLEVRDRLLGIDGHVLFFTLRREWLQVRVPQLDGAAQDADPELLVGQREAALLRPRAQHAGQRERQSDAHHERDHDDGDEDAEQPAPQAARRLRVLSGHRSPPRRRPRRRLPRRRAARRGARRGRPAGRSPRAADLAARASRSRARAPTGSSPRGR